MRFIKAFSLILIVTLLTWQCTSEQEPVPDDCLTDVPVLALDSKTDANCGLADGSITLTTASLATGVSITVNGNAFTGATLSNLAAGSYVIVATNAGGCTAELTVDILNIDGVNATATTTQSDCDNPTGSITINASGGSTPYEFKIGDNAFQSSASFEGLSPGEYAVTVKDAGGCEVVLQAEINSDVTFGEVSAIIQTNCAVSGCHNGTQSPDFRVTANIQSNAQRIMIRTGARTMPPSSSGRSLTAAEIDAIACWVTDGAPGN